MNKKKVSFSGEKLPCFPHGIRKRGISAVVATVLIILITVAAVTIIWAAIIPMIKDQTEGGTVCLDAVSQISIETAGGYTCYDSTAPAKVNVQVSRGAADFELAKLQIIISDADGRTKSSEVDVSEGTGGTNKLVVNGERVITRSGVNEITSATPVKVEIAPIVQTGSTEKRCDISSSAVLSACS